MNPNKRMDGEAFEEYRERRRLQNKIGKLRARGLPVWDSKTQGTYERAKHGELNEQR